MPGKSRRVLGEQGERLAEEFLRKLGCKILRRNWHSRLGEIDLIARDGDEVVFVEVKLRSSADWGAPAGSRPLWKEAQHLPRRERVRGPEPPARAHASVRHRCRAPAGRRRAGNPALQRRVSHRSSCKLTRFSLNPIVGREARVKKEDGSTLSRRTVLLRSGRLGLPPAHHPAFPDDRFSPHIRHSTRPTAAINRARACLFA